MSGGARHLLPFLRTAWPWLLLVALAAIIASFSGGLVVWCIAVALPLPESADGPGTHMALAFAIGVAIAAVWHSGLIPGSRPADPERRLSAFVLVSVALVDWLLAWAVFHLAVDGTYGDVTAGQSLRVFFFGQFVGLLSFVPGGLGSADLFWSIRLAGLAGGHDRVVAALLLYRLVYYVLPFLAATVVLSGHLVRAGRRTAVFVRSALATYAFVCGALLLGSAASPALHERLRFLENTVPVALVEISHGVSVAMGFLLLIVARGLARGYSGSRRIALALFSAGAIATFTKTLSRDLLSTVTFSCCTRRLTRSRIVSTRGIRTPTGTVSCGWSAVSCAWWTVACTSVAASTP